MNKPEKITGVLVDVKAGTVKETSLTAALPAYESTLQCCSVTFHACQLGAFRFTVLSSAAPQANDLVSALDGNGSPLLYGNLFFCKTDDNARLASLTPLEIGFIRGRAYTLHVSRTQSWPVIPRLELLT